MTHPPCSFWEMDIYGHAAGGLGPPASDDLPVKLGHLRIADNASL